MSLWLPNTARQEVERDNQAIVQMVLLDEAIKYFNKELKAIDADLELVKASNNATLAGLRPGYWHVLRKGTPTTILCLQGPNGEFREPGSWMFQWLLEQDMWNDATQRERKQRQARADAALAREKERERQDRIAEFNERYKQRTTIQVPTMDFKRGWKSRQDKKAA